jgi:hypothetical protein
MVGVMGHSPQAGKGRLEWQVNFGGWSFVTAKSYDGG